MWLIKALMILSLFSNVYADTFYESCGVPNKPPCGVNFGSTDEALPALTPDEMTEQTPQPQRDLRKGLFNEYFEEALDAIWKLSIKNVSSCPTFDVGIPAFLQADESIHTVSLHCTMLFEPYGQIIRSICLCAFFLTAMYIVLEA